MVWPRRCPISPFPVSRERRRGAAQSQISSDYPTTDATETNFRSLGPQKFALGVFLLGFAVSFRAVIYTSGTCGIRRIRACYQDEHVQRSLGVPLWHNTQVMFVRVGLLRGERQRSDNLFSIKGRNCSRHASGMWELRLSDYLMFIASDTM